MTKPNSNRRAGPCTIVLFLCCAATTLLAQVETPIAPQQQPKGGLQISSFSASADYLSNSLPNNGGGFQAGAANLPSDVVLGGNIVLSWTKFTDRSTISMNYTPSYTGRLRYSDLNALNHSFSFNATRKLAPRWSLGFSVGGNYTTLEQSLFSPTALSNVAAVPSNYNDLAAALLTAKFTNAQLGVALTNAPLVESPVANLLYGSRMFTSSAQSTLSYSFSPRLSVAFSGFASRTQHVSEDRVLTAANSFVIPNTTSGTAGVSLSYSLSPITQIGGSVTTNRVSSSLQDMYTTTSLATYGRTLGRRWIIQLHGGVGVTNPVRQTYSASTIIVSTKPGPVVGGSLGYKTFSHTFLGSFDRTVSDSYGLGASTSVMGNATWRWRRPGNSWWLESSFTWQQLQQSTALGNTSGWRATTGLNRSVGTHFILLWQYAYLNYSGGFQQSRYNLSQNAVRVSMVWTPQSNALR